MKKLVTLRLNKPGLVAEAGLPGARVLPRDSWLQREAVWPCANARRSGCQPAAALGMGCGGIVAWVNLRIRQIQLLAVKCLTVDIASVCDLGQLYCSLVYKAEKSSPIAGNAEREKANKWRGEALCVEQGVIGIGAQILNKNRELALLRFRESARVFMKLRVEYYFKHFVCFGARREISSRLRSVWWGHGWRHAGPGARIQDDIRPPDLSQRCLSRMSGAYALLFLKQSYSYFCSIPNCALTSIEINRWGCPFYAGVCTSSQQRESWEVLSLTPIERPPLTV